MESFSKLLPYLRRHIKRLILGFLGMAVFTAISLTPPLVLRVLVDEVITLGNWQFLLPAVGLIIFIPIITALLQFGNEFIISLAGNSLVSDIRKSIYSKVFDLSIKYHQENSSGVIVNRLMDDVNMLQRLITGDTMNIMIDLIVFTFSVSIVYSLNAVLATILLGTVVLYVIAYRIFASRIRSETSSYRMLQDRISERLQETVAGVRHVRIYTNEQRENSDFLSRTSESLQHALNSNYNSILLGTVCNLIAGFGSASIVSLGAYYVLNGWVSFGDVLAVNSYVWMALNPAIRLTNLAGQLNETFVSIRRVVEILDEPIDLDPMVHGPTLLRGAGAVKFEQVCFGYSPENKLYQGLDLEVQPGQTVALVGPTGCGKTTLTSLLMRHWDIQSGSILIDGTDIKTVKLRSLRQLFGVVLQNPIVYNGSLAENIAYGVPGADRRKIEEAAQAAEIWDMVQRFPQGFDTELGTHGIKLSLGEKQRVSIARAILKDPVILIMDEATSSLDSESEALIQKALAKVLRGRTSFVIAHRLSTITNADVIVVMDQGAIIEQGTHDQLMAIPEGNYRKLYDELRGSVQAETRDH